MNEKKRYFLLVSLTFVSKLDLAIPEQALARHSAMSERQSLATEPLYQRALAIKEPVLGLIASIGPIIGRMHSCSSS